MPVVSSWGVNMPEILSGVDSDCYGRHVNEGESGEASASGEGLPLRLVTANRLVAYNMAYFRKVAGKTQAELGESLGGWSNAAVSAAERSWDGKRLRQFHADEIVAIAIALGVPVIALLMPPPDAGTAMRYVLDAEPGQPDVLTVMRRLVPVYEGADTPALAAYRDRVMALGAGGYMYAEPDLILDRARREARELLLMTRSQTELMTGDARARAEALERDAQERHHMAMDALIQSREELERRVDDLRAFEMEYRRRLEAFLEAQLADLKAGGKPGPWPPARGQRGQAERDAPAGQEDRP